MRKRSAAALVTATAITLGVLWAHDVSQAEAVASHLSAEVVEVDQAKRVAVQERMDMESLMAEVEREAQTKTERIERLDERLSKVKSQRDKHKTTAEELRAVLDAERDVMEDQRERIQELTDKIAVMEADTWHGFTVGEVIVCEPGWIASVDETEEGGQWAACM